MQPKKDKKNNLSEKIFLVFSGGTITVLLFLCGFTVYEISSMNNNYAPLIIVIIIAIFCKIMYPYLQIFQEMITKIKEK